MNFAISAEGTFAAAMSVESGSSIIRRRWSDDKSEVTLITSHDSKLKTAATRSRQPGNSVCNLEYHKSTAVDNKNFAGRRSDSLLAKVRSATWSRRWNQ